MWLLECNKTGRFIRQKTEAMARRAAHQMGITDYTLTPPKT